MKKSQFIIIPILLIQLLLPIVYAEVNYELVFSGEVPNNEEFTADGKTFHVVTIDSTRAKVKFPNSLSAILYVGECKFEANYNYCLTSIRQGEFDIPSQDYPLYPNVKIEKPHVVVSMSRTFGKTSILKGETTKVEVSISNSGSYSVMDAQFIDEYPSDIRISGVVDCEVSGNKVLWDGNIGLNNPVEFSYYIKGLKDTEFSSKAYLIFEEDNISESQTITVKESQLRVNTTITPEEVDLSKEVFIQIYLENLNGEYALQDMEYRIYLPDNVIQLNKKDDALERRGSYYRFNTDFEAKSKTNMTINMTMLEEGTYKVKEKIVYTINELKEEVNYEKTINVIQKKLEMKVEETSGYEVGDTVTIPVKVKNPSGDKFTTLQIDVKSDLDFEKKKITIEKIMPYETITAMELSFEIPPTQLEGFDLNFTLIYENRYRDRLSDKASIRMIIGNENPSPENTENNEPQENNQENTTEESTEQNTNTQSAQSGGIGGGGIGTSSEGLPEYRVNYYYSLKDATIPVLIASSIAVTSILIFIFVKAKQKKNKEMDEKIDSLE